MFDIFKIGIVLLFIFLCAGTALSIIYWSWRNGITPMPSSGKACKKILEALPQNLQGPIYELGSGWGTLAFALAKNCPESFVVGYETSLLPYGMSRLFMFASRVSNLCFKREDFMKASLKEAQVIVCYLYPEAMQRLEEKFRGELQPGTWVISNTFAIPGWTPYATLETNDLYRSVVYVYCCNTNVGHLIRYTGRGLIL